MVRSQFFVRLFVSYALLVVISAIVLSAVATNALSELNRTNARSTLYGQALLLGELVGGDIKAGRTPSTHDVQRLGRQLETRLTVIGIDGVVLLDTREHSGNHASLADRPEVQQAQTAPFGFAAQAARDGHDAALHVAVAIRDGERQVGTVRASMDTRALVEAEARLRMGVLLGAMVAVLAALVLGFFYAQRVVQPMRQLTRIAREISDGNFDQDIDLVAEGEFGVMARAFNKMKDSLRDRIDTIRQDHNELSAILGSMVEGVIALGSDGRISQINQSALTMLNITESDIQNKSLWEVTRISGLLEAVNQVSDGRSDVRASIHPMADHEERDIEVLATRLQDPNSEELTGIVVVLYDVTELRRLETVRRDFVSNVSHELKTPLTAIRGMLESLIADIDVMDRSVRDRFLARASSQVDRLSNIVTDLLTLGRFESERTTVDRAPVDLRGIIRATVRAISPVAENRGLSVLLAIPDKPVMVMGDEDALAIVVNNLVDNAVKYTSQGGSVKVSLRYDGGEALLSVEDSGIGIPEADLDRIFERFYRVDKARSRELGGTGLGLSIVKHILLAHGGRVAVESELGRGSQFSAWLPLLRVQDPPGKG